MGVNVLAEWHWAMAEEARLSSTFTDNIAWISKNNYLRPPFFLDKVTFLLYVPSLFNTTLVCKHTHTHTHTVLLTENVARGAN